MEVTAGKRAIKDGAMFDKLFPKPENNEILVGKNCCIDETLFLIAKLVNDYSYQTEKVSKVLKGSNNKYETCKNIYNFVYNHIQYSPDKLGTEQLRTPARSWADRDKGVDCDCMTILVCSMLKNCGINYFFRITKYNSDEFEHIYTVVPINNKTVLIIDPVLSRFDYEKEYSAKKDYSMNGMPIEILNGPAERITKSNLINNNELISVRITPEEQVNILLNYVYVLNKQIPDASKRQKFNDLIPDIKAITKMLAEDAALISDKTLGKTREERKAARKELREKIGKLGNKLLQVGTALEIFTGICPPCGVVGGIMMTIGGGLIGGTGAWGLVDPIIVKLPKNYKLLKTDAYYETVGLAILQAKQVNLKTGKGIEGGDLNGGAYWLQGGTQMLTYCSQSEYAGKYAEGIKKFPANWDAAHKYANVQCAKYKKPVKSAVNYIVNEKSFTYVSVPNIKEWPVYVRALITGTGTEYDGSKWMIIDKWDAGTADGHGSLKLDGYFKIGEVRKGFVETVAPVETSPPQPLPKPQPEPQPQLPNRNNQAGLLTGNGLIIALGAAALLTIAISAGSSKPGTRQKQSRRNLNKSIRKEKLN